LPSRQPRVDARALASKPRDLDATTRFIFTQPETADAISEHRAEARIEVKAAVFNLREMGDQPRHDLSARAHEHREPSEQRTI
jgi:hypothetical protein